MTPAAGKHYLCESNNPNSSTKFFESLTLRTMSTDEVTSHRRSARSEDEDVRDIMQSQSSGLERNAETSENPNRGVSGRQWLTVSILCFVNMINYMDRYTIAGILTGVQEHFHIGDVKGGLLQTAFVVSYMIFAPSFGYLGDRYNRKVIMAAGVFLWSLTTLAGSFMETYLWFLFFRALVGIGEASYSTIAPTIISDLFAHSLRSKMLALFYFAIPVGSGLGYIVGSCMAQAFGGWQWGLRLTPFVGTMAVLLILFFMREPVRGESDGARQTEATSYATDIKILVKNWSFMLSTGGFTCVAFVAGALAWWGPKCIYLGLKLQSGYEDISFTNVSFVFGVITVCSGLSGVPFAYYLSNVLRRSYPNADPLICGAGLFGSAVFLVAVFLTASRQLYACFVSCFLAQFFLAWNWAVPTDITLYVVAPSRRSTAEAFQILVSHAFGDAGSPYLIGLLSEIFKEALKDNSWGNNKLEFTSLQYALFVTSFVEVFGALFFLMTALHVEEDRKSAQRELEGRDNPAAEAYSDETAPASG